MKLTLMALLLLSNAAFAAVYKYDCKNDKIDEDALYIKKSYLITIDTQTKKAVIEDEDGETDSVVTGPLTRDSNARLVGGFEGNVWSDAGCSVNYTLTKEIMAGAKKASVQFDQDGECQARPVWLACTRR